MLKNLGYKLKTLRVRNQLSRKQVAELVGVSVSTIGLYESNERLPSLPVLVKLACQYKTSVDYLLNIDTSDKNSLSLDGLTDKQIKALKMTAECFRNSN
ncbi:helix-turn-helix domain-containing protein [Roseburia inulinivorans]|jgi:transcriptional regulator with XRE-family HTH domain